MKASPIKDDILIGKTSFDIMKQLQH